MYQRGVCRAETYARHELITYFDRKFEWNTWMRLRRLGVANLCRFFSVSLSFSSSVFHFATSSIDR